MVALFVGLIVYILALPLVCAFALICGGRTERRFAIAVIAAMVLSQLGALVLNRHWQSPEIGVAIVDGLLFAIFLVLARHSERFWPIWATAAQLIAFLSHIPPMMISDMPEELYVGTQAVWAFPVFAAMAIGTLGEVRLRRFRSTSS